MLNIWDLSRFQRLHTDIVHRKKQCFVLVFIIMCVVVTWAATGPEVNLYETVKNLAIVTKTGSYTILCKTIIVVVLRYLFRFLKKRSDTDMHTYHCN